MNKRKEQKEIRKNRRKLGGMNILEVQIFFRFQREDNFKRNGLINSVKYCKEGKEDKKMRRNIFRLSFMRVGIVYMFDIYQVFVKYLWNK